jgi:hypothetical protein
MTRAIACATEAQLATIADEVRLIEIRSVYPWRQGWTIDRTTCGDPTGVMLPGITKSSVSGVGDDAIAETLGELTTLFVKKGNTTFMVRVYRVSAAAKQLTIETPIAQAIAAKL